MQNSPGYTGSVKNASLRQIMIKHMLNTDPMSIRSIAAPHKHDVYMDDRTTTRVLTKEYKVEIATLKRRLIPAEKKFPLKARHPLVLFKCSDSSTYATTLYHCILPLHYTTAFYHCTSTVNSTTFSFTFTFTLSEIA